MGATKQALINYFERNCYSPREIDEALADEGACRAILADLAAEAEAKREARGDR